MTISKLLLIIGFFSSSIFSFGQKSLSVVNLKCEYEANPMGIETSKPRLSWQINTGLRNQIQIFYRVLVADSPEKLKASIGNIWDSKKKSSSQSILVEYNGSPLLAAKKYYWKVKIWNQSGEESDWSEIASWQMGLLTKADWGKASWITMPDFDEANFEGMDVKAKLAKTKNILPQFRKDFQVVKPVKQAVAFISGLGHFELRLNGQKVSDHFLDPGWTNYEKYCLYVPFDITSQLQRGTNTLGVMLGNGFYQIPSGRYRKAQLTLLHGFPKMICKVLIDYIDGTSEIVESDQSWKVTRSPITFGTIYGGEDYDATLEQDGWDKPGFDDKSWQSAIVVKGNEKILSQRNNPLKVMEVLPAVSVFKSHDGNWVYDLGQNASGIVRLQVKGKAGDVVRLVLGELINPDSSVNQKATGSLYCFTYTLKGNGIETWQPQFSYYGFRYVQLEGAVPKGQENPKGQPEAEAITGLHTRNSAVNVGSFSCSNDLFNKTNTLIDWSIKSNMSSVLTDCPHREKLGWLEQTYLMGTSLQYNYDMTRIFSKTMDDMQSVQLEDGLVPEIAPEYCVFNDKDGKPGIFRDSPEWGSAYVILPWYMYQWYGDKRLLEQNYEGMKRYVDYLGSKAAEGIVSFGLGDWYDLGPKHPGPSQLTSLGVTGTATWYYDAVILSQTAQLLGNKPDFKKYDQIAKQVREAFNRKYFNKETCQYDQNSQTANAMAIYLGLVEPHYKAKVLESLIKDIRSRNNALTAGDIGYRYVLQALEEGNASDVIFDMNNRSDVPGYGYQLKQGATALTESWQALRGVSNNHLMLGHLMEWFYSGLAGIRQEQNSVAYKNILIKPEIVGNVTRAKADFKSPYGFIKSSWHKEGTMFNLDVEIPANTSAIISLPSADRGSVTEGGKQPGKEISFLGKENNRLLYKVGSGSYSFSVNIEK